MKETDAERYVLKRGDSSQTAGRRALPPWALGAQGAASWAEGTRETTTRGAAEVGLLCPLRGRIRKGGCRGGLLCPLRGRVRKGGRYPGDRTVSVLENNKAARRADGQTAQAQAFILCMATPRL